VAHRARVAVKRGPKAACAWYGVGNGLHLSKLAQRILEEPLLVGGEARDWVSSVDRASSRAGVHGLSARCSNAKAQQKNHHGPNAEYQHVFTTAAIVPSGMRQEGCRNFKVTFHGSLLSFSELGSRDRLARLEFFASLWVALTSRTQRKPAFFRTSFLPGFDTSPEWVETGGAASGEKNSS
jgi:hypothetical protein